MAPHISKIRYKGGGNPFQTVKAARGAVGAALGASVMLWWQRFLPGHFLPAARNKYGYQQRSEKYNKYKIRRFGSRCRADLVYTGKSRDMAKSGIQIKEPRGKNKDHVQVVGVLKLPRYFYAYRKDRDQPDKANEVTRTTEAEMGFLTQEYQKDLQRRIDDSLARQTNQEERVA